MGRGDEGVGYRWRRRASSDAGSGPVAAAAAAPVLAVPLLGISAGAGVGNKYQQKAMPDIYKKPGTAEKAQIKPPTM